MNQLQQTIQEYIFGRNYNGVVLCCNKTLENEPNNLDALGGRAIAYEYLGKPEKAIIDLTKILDFEPDNSYALIERGGAYSMNNEDEKACNDYLTAIDIDKEKTNCDLFSPEAKEWCKKGKYDLAIKLYDKLIENTHDTEIEKYRGEAYLEKGKIL